jgi:hypothetical protein
VPLPRRPKNSLDLPDGDPVNLGHLLSRHSVPAPLADARKLGSRNFRRHLLFWAD